MNHEGGFSLEFKGRVVEEFMSGDGRLVQLCRMYEVYDNEDSYRQPSDFEALLPIQENLGIPRQALSTPSANRRLQRH